MRRTSSLKPAVYCSVVLGALLSLAGCGAEEGSMRGGPGDASGGKADDADGDGDGTQSEAQKRHLEDVGGCESLANRLRSKTSSLRIAESLEIEETRLECLRDANDGVRDELNAALSDESSNLAGETDERFDEWRNQHSKFCGLLVEGSDVALSKAASVRQTACLAEAELKLAEAIEAYGDLDGVNSKGADAEDEYEGCYEAYEDALEAAENGDAPPPPAEDEGEEETPEDTGEETPEDTGEETPEDTGEETPEDTGEETPEDTGDDETPTDASTPESLKVDATEALAGCIQTETEKLEDDISTRVVESFPGREGTGIDQDVTRALSDTAKVADTACELLVASSGGDELNVALCEVSTSIWREDLIGYVIPELEPDPRG